MLGVNQSFTAFGGVVGGLQNKLSGPYSAVFGDANTASGYESAVAGGYNNTASGVYSAVAGGSTNTASGTASLARGGQSQNVTTAYGYAP